MPNYETEQLCALLESLIDQSGHNTPKLTQGLIEKLPEYFMGDDVKRDGNKIVLTNKNENFEDIQVGIIEIYEEHVKGSFPSSKIEDLKQYKNNNSLQFAFLIEFNTNNHILIREVDDKVTFLDLDYNT